MEVMAKNSHQLFHFLWFMKSMSVSGASCYLCGGESFAFSIRRKHDQRRDISFAFHHRRKWREVRVGAGFFLISSFHSTDCLFLSWPITHSQRKCEDGLHHWKSRKLTEFCYCCIYIYFFFANNFPIDKYIKGRVISGSEEPQPGVRSTASSPGSSSSF